MRTDVRADLFQTCSLRARGDRDRVAHRSAITSFPAAQFRAAIR
jgi:hypothetical protein